MKSIWKAAGRPSGRILSRKISSLRITAAQEGRWSFRPGQVTERLSQAQGQVEEQDQAIRLLEQQIEDEKSQIIGALNEKAAINAKQQRYEAMMEQVHLRKSEVSQKLLKYKSDESLQEEQIQKEKSALGQVEKSFRPFRER